MCVRMALSCVFCASDWEAKHSHEATMQHYRAPQGQLHSVREGTSSQERGSEETFGRRGSEDSRDRRVSGDNGTPSVAEGNEAEMIGSDVGQSLSMEEARRRSHEANRRVSDEDTRRHGEKARKSGETNSFEERRNRTSEEHRSAKMSQLLANMRSKSPTLPLERMPSPGPPRLARTSLHRTDLPALPDCLS